MSRLPRLGVYLVTDRRAVSPDARTIADELTALERFLDAAIDAAVDVVQLRERDLEARALVDLATRLGRRAAGTTTQVLVNERADVALAASVAGVHLRAESAAVDRVRALGPPGWIVGRSIHAEAEVAAHAAADYLLFGSVFSSGSKPGGAPVAGLEALARVAAASAAPVVAIGGIDAVRAARCVAAGARGLAGIAIFLPEGRTATSIGPARGVAAFRDALE